MTFYLFQVKVAYQNILILSGTLTRFVKYSHEEKKEIVSQRIVPTLDKLSLQIYGIFENMDIDELNEFKKVAIQIKASNPLL